MSVPKLHRLHIAGPRYYIADMRYTIWNDLLEVARWGPSAHNIQPWRLRPVSEDAAALLCAPDRPLPDTDPTGRFTMVGLGVFVETLAIAARETGNEVDAQYEEGPLRKGHADGIPLARLRFVSEDDQANKRLAIALELVEGREPPGDLDELPERVIARLAEINQDFREAVRFMPPEAVPRLAVHVAGTGLFAGHDVRLKRRYVMSAERS
jgi:hypothetical protein